MIAYVYLAGLAILFVAKLIVHAFVELLARMNVLGLTNVFARECKIARNNDPLRVDFASNSDPS
jgi:hypothetical protein